MTVGLALLLGCDPAGAGQDIRFRRVSVEDGLSNRRVNCFHQDRTGFMWIGTEDGLNRYDGNEFLVFRPESREGAEDPPVFSVRTIHADVEGFLWVGGANSGFSKFDPATGRFVETYRYDGKLPDGLQAASVLTIQGTGDGRLWIGTDWGGLHRFDPESKKLEHFPLRKPEPGNTNQGVIFAIHRSSSHPGVVWLGTAWMGLIRFDSETSEIRRFLEDPPGDHDVKPPTRVSAIVEDPQGAFWISAAVSCPGLFRFDPEEGRFIAAYEFDDDREGSPPGGLNSVFLDREGRIWVTGVRSGMAEFLPGSGEFRSYRYDPADQHSLAYAAAGTFFQDRAGLIWVGMRRAGICTFDPDGEWIVNHQIEYHGSGRINPIKVSCLLEDEGDPAVAWLGSNEGLCRWNRRSGETRFYRHDPDDPSSLSSNVITGISRREAGGFWIGTGRGLNRYDPESDRVIRFEARAESARKLAHPAINCLEEDTAGRLWIGVRPGLYLYEPRTGEAQRIRRDPENPQSLPWGWIVQIHEDRNGHMWFGSQEHGLAQFSPRTGKFVRLTHDPENRSSLDSDRILSFHEDRESGVLWVGTARGLNRIVADSEGTGELQISRIDGLPPSRVFSIAGDHEELWLGTSSGLIRVNDATEAAPTITLASQEVGPHLKLLTDSPTALASGGFLVGTHDGVIELRPDRYQAGAPPAVVITDFQGIKDSAETAARGKLLLGFGSSTAAPLTLRHEQNKVLTFKFAALDYGHPEENRYSYRLEGLQDEWHEVEGARSATYTTLRPGDYVFHVRAANSQGVWNEEGASLALTILPPWWATWWFRSAAVAVILGSGVAVGGARIRGVRRRADTLEEEGKKRDELNRALQISEERFQNLLSNSSEQVWCIELDPPVPLEFPEMEQVNLILERARFVEADDATAEAYEMPREELIGSRLEAVMPRSLPTTIPLLREVVQAGYRMTEFETTELARDGSEKIMVNSVIGTVKEGKVLRVWGTARDITEQKRALELRRQHRDELAHASRVATMGGLTAAIAHELNQPLAAIGANAQAARRFMAGPDRNLEEVDAILDDIVSDNERAAEVIRRMRNLLKKQTGKEESLDLNQLIEGVETLVHSDAIIRKINLELRLDSSIPSVQAGRTEIQQVLLNLILNGFDAMADVAPEERLLIIRTETIEPGSVQVTVIDRGHGLEDTERVFEPFHTTKAEGLGMGLAINETIIESYGGRIWAENNADQGSRFCFSLPVEHEDVHKS